MRESNGHVDNGVQVGNNGPEWMATVEGVENTLKIVAGVKFKDGEKVLKEQVA
jgi:hypothetical protein